MAYSIDSYLTSEQNTFLVNLTTATNMNIHWRQTGLNRGGAEREFETHLSKFETYLVLRDYETEKTRGAPAPAAPASLAPM